MLLRDAEFRKLKLSVCDHIFRGPRTVTPYIIDSII